MLTKIFRDIRAWFEGNYRYNIYYSLDWGWLMRPHIREQIDWRINIMDKECYSSGQCKICGCQTTALQMANKRCDKPCYPRMMNKRSWAALKDVVKLLHKKNPELFYKEICGEVKK